MKRVVVRVPGLRLEVAPFTGAWIETLPRTLGASPIACRPLHGGVD